MEFYWKKFTDKIKIFLEIKKQTLLNHLGPVEWLQRIKDWHLMVVYKGVFFMQKYLASKRELNIIGANISSEYTWV